MELKKGVMGTGLFYRLQWYWNKRGGVVWALEFLLDSRGIATREGGCMSIRWFYRMSVVLTPMKWVRMGMWL